jgi:hypothetical protein
MKAAPSLLLPALPLLFALLFVTGCIGPKYYHVGGPPGYAVEPPARLDFQNSDPRYGEGYFRTSVAYEAYVEFNEKAALYRDAKKEPLELQQALDMIRRCRFRANANSRLCPEPGEPLSSQAKPITLYIFVHGWKNSASEDTNNPWGFRRFLSYASWLNPTAPVVGIYIGWPGASLKGDLFLSFWNRQPVANRVGISNDLLFSLKSLLYEAKGELKAGETAGKETISGPFAFKSADPSTAIVIGHSFGGIVLERAATALLQDAFKSIPRSEFSTPVIDVYPPADLIVLINEAGAASIGMPFLDRLKAAGVSYTCNTRDPAYPNDLTKERKDIPCPLLLSMTSEGDLATKFAYPGGEFFSTRRPSTEKYSKPDQWGQGSSLPYNLITAANFIALQNHSIDKVAQADASCFVVVHPSPKESYCMHSLPNSAHSPQDPALYPNGTPYWSMQLPQVFVPDHGTVFQPSFLELLNSAAKSTNYKLRLSGVNLPKMQIQ